MRKKSSAERDADRRITGALLLLVGSILATGALYEVLSTNGEPPGWAAVPLFTCLGGVVAARIAYGRAKRARRQLRKQLKQTAAVE